MADLNINNLTLDDNSFKLLDEGTYHFTVSDHSVDYYSGDSTKIPANTQVVTANLEIPCTDENGELAVVKVRNKLNIYRGALFAVRQFAECIGLCDETGRKNVNLDEMDGKSGICEITHYTSPKGNTYNNVDRCYSPSKAPKVCVNDKEFEAWKNGDGFESVEKEEMPWAKE